jgi:hypothetical protein
MYTPASNNHPPGCTELFAPSMSQSASNNAGSSRARSFSTIAHSSRPDIGARHVSPEPPSKKRRKSSSATVVLEPVMRTSRSRAESVFNNLFANEPCHSSVTPSTEHTHIPTSNASLMFHRLAPPRFDEEISCPVPQPCSNVHDTHTSTPYGGIHKCP